MLATALRPRFLGLLLVALVCIAAFVQLGRWQLGVAQDSATQRVLAEAAAAPVADLASVLAPHESFPGSLSARRVRVSGQWSQDQVFVMDRRLEGRHGAWVVTAFRTDEGAVLPVLRGFTEDLDRVPAPSSGRVRLLGGLAPGESPAARADLPEGQLRSVDLAVLVNRWSGATYDAFLFLESQEVLTNSGPTDPASPTGQADPGGDVGLTLVPTPSRSAGLSWRNASYAAQWWAFAVFALWLWWRMVRDEYRRTTAANPSIKNGTDSR